MTNEPVELLLVEDNEDDIVLIQEAFADAKLMNVICKVRDGEEAVAYLRREGRYQEVRRPGLILLDINMPRLDGIETLRQLKAHDESKTIPVVMLTTTDDPNEIERCYQLGCGIYVTKPVDGEKFSEAVTRLGLFLQVVTIPLEHAA